MLKQIKLRAQLKDLKAQLEALRSQKSEWEQRKADLEKREAELTTALDEAQTDEDLDAVNSGIADLEVEAAELGENSGVEDKISETERAISEIEAELSALAEKTDKNEAPDGDARNNMEVINMNKRTAFGRLPAETRDRYLSDESVKSFVSELRSMMSKRGVTNGNIAIPQVFLGFISENMEKYSRMASVIDVRNVPGVARIGVVGTFPEAVWTDACADINEVNLAFAERDFDGYKVGGYIPVCNKLLDATDGEILAAVMEALLQSIGYAIDKAVIYGTGIRMPHGIVNRLAQQSQPSDWEAKAPTWTDLHSSNLLKLNLAASTGAEFFSALAAAFGVADGKYSQSKNMFYAMNHKTHMDIKAKGISFDSAAAIVSKIDDTMPVVGGKIVELDFLPDYEIVFGFGDEYIYAERQGANIEQSEHVFFLKDQTVFKGTAVGDGKPLFGEAFGVVNYHNTDITTTATFAGDTANANLVYLSALQIGTTAATLLPQKFDPEVTSYHCTVTAHSQKITATALNSGATVVIKNGDSTVTSGGNATFSAGENTLTVTVTNGTAQRVYTVIVNDATSTS